MYFWTRRHLVEMTRAYVIYFPAAATATAPIFPNWCNLKSHNSVIFEARTLKFCVEVDMDIPLLDLTSILTSALTSTSTLEVKSLK